ncbi:MAG: glycerophosphodiester phosphodiesterase family protein [Prolixibacteraceae bacterium]|jgi:glycerophosphoryl diester phosphodiesterase|nr:glycerophosphodiester phosphodiesterase family protein [Prolixibacteraceae bacterium]
MNNKSKLLALSALLLLLSLAPDSRFKTTLTNFHDANAKYIMVAAHRSAHNGHPENSISALKHAIEIGVDIAELDVKVTKDSVVVLMHDGKIDRTTNGKGNPENYTLAELKKFRLKMDDGTLTNETIPTFEDFLNIAKGKIMVDIDIKTSHLKPVVDAVKRTKTQDQVFYFDNDYDALKKVRSMDKTSLFMPRAYNYKMADSALKIFSPKVIHIDETYYTPELTKLIRGKNARIWINALGEPDDLIRKGEIEKAIDQILKYRANIIQTDEPEKVLEYLRSKGLHN